MQNEISKALTKLVSIEGIVENFYLNRWWLVDVKDFFSKVNLMKGLLITLQNRVQFISLAIAENEKKKEKEDATLAFEKEKLAVEKRKLELQEEAQDKKNKTLYIAGK